MKTRAEAVEIINNQIGGGKDRGLVYIGDFDCETRFTKRYKGVQFHYGKQELRELMDLIYGGEPVDESEEIK